MKGRGCRALCCRFCGRSWVLAAKELYQGVSRAVLGILRVLLFRSWVPSPQLQVRPCDENYEQEMRGMLLIWLFSNA